MADRALMATPGSNALRVFAWTVVAVTFTFIANNVLTFWVGLPGASALVSGFPETSGGGAVILALVQLLLYAAALAGPVLYVLRSVDQPLRADAAAMSAVVRFLIRFAFWTVLLVGLADFLVSFLRVENLLGLLVGETTAAAWGFNANRAPQLHLPMVGIALVLAVVTRTLGVHWLSLFVVLSELSIVLSRFVFSYEQALQADLVRFWYGSLFLFASAYTLYEDGHVRVDVVYANLGVRTQGAINAIGAVVLGMLLCWTILILGMAGPSSTINAPLLSLEITQAGFGMYVKYLMSGFLAVFAVSMMTQFCAMLLDGVADYRGDPGGRAHHVHGDAVTEV